MGKHKNKSHPLDFDEFLSQSQNYASYYHEKSPQPSFPLEDIYPYEDGPPPEVILHPDVRAGRKPPPPGVVRQPEPHPYRGRIRCYHLMACVVYICCNCFLGAIAFEYAGYANQAAKSGNLSRARSLGRCSCWLSFLAILINIGIALGLVFLKFFPELQDLDNWNLDWW